MGTSNVLSLIVVLSLVFLGCCTDQMTLRLFSVAESDHLNARCLDGSPYGYYFSPSKSFSASKKWVFWLDSGGFCSGRGCVMRTKTAQGSSKYWSHSESAAFQLVSRSQEKNPTFWDWNFVVLPYCSGDLHVGRVTTPTKLSEGTYMTGHYNVIAVINDLKAFHGLDSATDVVLTGTSAGGYGTFLNVDLFAERISSAHVVGVPQSGLFFWPLTYQSWLNATGQHDDSIHDNHNNDHKKRGHKDEHKHHKGHGKKRDAHHHKMKPTNGQRGGDLVCEENLNVNPAETLTLKDLVDLWQPYLHPECVKDTPDSEKFRCLNVGYMHKHIESALFVVNPLYDTDQLWLHLGAPTYQDPMPPLLEGYVSYFGDCLSKIKNRILDVNKESSVFMPSCLCHDLKDAGPQAVKIDGHTISDILQNYFSNRNPYFAVDNCPGVACNPTCPPPDHTER